jgi:hypothetical protein
MKSLGGDGEGDEHDAIGEVDSGVEALAGGERA